MTTNKLFEYKLFLASLRTRVIKKRNWGIRKFLIWSSWWNYFHKILFSVSVNQSWKFDFELYMVLYLKPAFMHLFLFVIFFIRINIPSFNDHKIKKSKWLQADFECRNWREEEIGENVMLSCTNLRCKYCSTVYFQTHHKYDKDVRSFIRNVYTHLTYFPMNAPTYTSWLLCTPVFISANHKLHSKKKE